MRSILLFLCLTTAGSAATIDFVGEPTGVSDGSYYVLPYEITINGVAQSVTCYDTHDEVNPGDTWTANLLTLTQAAATGYFSNTATPLASYERVAWLSVQTYSNTDQQIGLQHAIWNVFGTASVTPATSAYEAAANAAAATGYAGFNFSGISFIEQVGGVPGKPGTYQAFVSDVPEPGSIGMFAGGALLIAIGTRRFKPRAS